jgi:hypothetical protein
MGNSESKEDNGDDFSPNLMPRNLLDCVDLDGQINLESYWLFRRRRRQEQDEDDISELLSRCFMEAEQEMVIDCSEPSNRRRRMKRDFLNYRNLHGEVVPLTWEVSSWYTQYINSPNLESPKFHDKFRRRFRMPYATFVEFMDEVKQDPIFVRWMKNDAAGKSSSPIELMVMGALRYLGRGWTFDDIEEATAISEETHRQFFHVFITWGSEYLFKKYVSTPKEKEEALRNMQEFCEAGFNGCAGSSDATHIGMEKCSHWMKQTHSGGKLPMPSRTYNITVNHRRWILSTTKGHPARWNDKTLQLFDEFLVGLNDGSILDDVEFELFEYDDREGDDASVVSAKYTGVWVIVDNGYIHWSVCQPPYKNYKTYKQQRWSDWCESMRKDVECTFGILKGRFRILKSGVRLHKIESTDKIWLTCCALHNMLLEVDGLDKGWDTGALSPWETDMGMHNPHDCNTRNFAMHRLMNPADFSRLDHSALGRGNDAPEPTPEDPDDVITRKGKTYPKGHQGVRVVRELDFDYFRERLVEHFDILFQRNQIKWLACHRKAPPHNT